MRIQLATIVLAALMALPAAANSWVTVELKDGRTFTGEISSRTDQRRLWLRFGDSAVTLLRPIGWNRISGGACADLSLTADELRSAALQGRNQSEIRNPKSEIATPEVTYAQQAREALGLIREE